MSLWLAAYSVCFAQTAKPESAPATPADKQTDSAAPSTSAQPAATQPAASGGDLSFDLFEEDKKKTESPEQAKAAVQAALATEKAGRIRRAMLTTHQAMGFATLAALATTLVVGQFNYQDKYVNGQFTGRFERAHLGLGIATSVMFASTGSLALFSPDPYPKKYRLDTAMIHRVAMAMATAGMVTQMVLGPIVDWRTGRLDQPRLALGHLITGYATFAFMATGTIAYFF
jgi:hypothetical protein